MPSRLTGMSDARHLLYETPQVASSQMPLFWLSLAFAVRRDRLHGLCNVEGPRSLPGFTVSAGRRAPGSSGSRWSKRSSATLPRGREREAPGCLPRSDCDRVPRLMRPHVCDRRRARERRPRDGLIPASESRGRRSGDELHPSPRRRRQRPAGSEVVRRLAITRLGEGVDERRASSRRDRARAQRPLRLPPRARGPWRGAHALLRHQRRPRCRERRGVPR